MRRARQSRWLLPALVAGLGAFTGCLGFTQNPSYFPYYLPAGDVIPTHAKPPGLGYFANFDPHAVRLEVRPTEITNPVRTQQVFLATIYDEKNQPRRRRRVEWMLEGVGNIVEVDESGYAPGRGYKVDNKYAVSYTDYHEHTITRGTADPNDDFTVRPGQSWCVVSAAVEGDSYVTVYAPEIHDWNRHKVNVTCHWVDADWQFPAPVVARVGTQQPIVTSVFRHTDKQPLANYRVRYRLLDGPPAVFLQNRGAEAVAVSDLSGQAAVSLVQLAPAAGGGLAGVNHIGIEIIRAPDPQVPSGAGIPIGRGETAVDWQGPRVTLSIVGPPTAAVRQQVPYTITVANGGQIETQPLTVRSVIPDGVQYLSSSPPANRDGNQLVWTLAPLAGGQTSTVQLTHGSLRPGPITTCADVTAPEGVRADACATTQVTEPRLGVALAGPSTGVLAMPITYTITVNNPGTGPANNVLLTCEPDPGLEHESRSRTVELPVGTLAPGQTKPYTLTLTPRQNGPRVNRVTATADGGLRETSTHTVTVQQSSIRLDLRGPQAPYVNRPADWQLTVTNPSDVPLNAVSVRAKLPAELGFVAAGDGGQFADGWVTWNLGTLAPRQERTITLSTRTLAVARQAVLSADALADPNLRDHREASVEILGLSAFNLELRKAGDPAPVGERVTYTITVTNIGSLAGRDLQVFAALPPELELVPDPGPNRPIRAPDGRLMFPVVAELPPQRTFTYTVDAIARKAGVVQFAVELRSSSFDRTAGPVVKTESTTVYDPNNPRRPER